MRGNRRMSSLVLVIYTTGLFGIVTSSDENIPRPCSSDYDFYNKDSNKCVKLHTTPKPWQEAREHCQNEAGDLVVITNAQTSNFITDIIVQNNIYSKIWIGLREIGTLRTSLGWVDGTPLGYSQWLPREPTNDSRAHQDCVELAGQPPQWNDLSCSYLRQYFCEKSPTVNTACPSGFVSYSTNRKCVKAVHDAGLSWNGARAACRESGADLVVIRDEPYNTFIKSLLRDSLTYWIGLTHSTAHASGFEWIDGSPLSYTQWAEDEPSSQTVETARGEMSLLNHGWTDQEVDTRPMGAICQKDFHEPTSCREGNWIHHKGDGKCYQVQMDARSFHESRAKCRREGGDLVSVTTFDRVDYFIDLVTEFDPSQDYWFNGVEESSTSCVAGLLVPNGATPGVKMAPALCYTLHPSVCERPALRDGLLLECPHGYATHVTSTAGGKITCLMAESHVWMTKQDAKRACQEDGGDLYPYESGETERNDFVKTLLITNWWYWLEYVQCSIYSAGRGIDQVLCSQMFYHICKHWGYVKDSVQVRNIHSMVGDSIHDSMDPSRSFSVLDFCRGSGMDTRSNNNSDFIQTNTTNVYLIMERSLNNLTEEKQNTRCFHGTHDDCCTDVTFTGSTDLATNEFELRMSIPTEKLHCLCPEPVTITETINLLKNLTRPQNTSSPPQNNLCPCRCSSKDTNFNPSPQELTLILSKIRQDLKVDSQTLSSKRNKKRSAPDTRNDSTILGYIGVALCLVPVCLTIAIDISRLVK